MMILFVTNYIKLKNFGQELKLGNMLNASHSIEE
jgi:hypothetical protein